MSTLIGIVLVLLTCCVAFGIMRIANRNIREYVESEHESFLGK